jgi:hypothetical protein
MFGDEHSFSGVSAINGLLFVNLYGGILNAIGWTKYNAYMLSTLFLLGSAVIWALTLKKLGFDKKIILSFVLAMLVLEPFYGAAHIGRIDSMAFFLSSFSFCLFVYKKFFFAAFVLILGMESHLLAATGAFYFLSFLIINPAHIFLNKRTAAKAIFSMIAGCAVGVAIYLTLSYDNLDKFFPHIFWGISGESIFEKNYLINYFFLTKFKRHIPELLIILFSLVVFIKQKLYKKYMFVLSFFFIVILSTLVFRRGEHFYAHVAFPPFILLISTVFCANNKDWLLNFIWFCLLLPQYSMVLYIERNFPGENERLAEIREQVPKTDIPIYGSADMWYAFIGKQDFYHYVRIVGTDDSPFIVSAADDSPGAPPPAELISKVSEKYNCEFIKTYQSSGKEYNTWRCDKKVLLE